MAAKTKVVGRVVTRTIEKEVPGPERVVEKYRDLPPEVFAPMQTMADKLAAALAQLGQEPAESESGEFPEFEVKNNRIRFKLKTGKWSEWLGFGGGSGTLIPNPLPVTVPLQPEVKLMMYDPETTTWVPVVGTGESNSNGGIYTNQQMPSHGFNRTKHENVVRMTASGLMGTWTSGTHLHFATLDFSGINTSVAAATRFRIRQGSLTGPIKYEFQHGTAAVGAPEHFSHSVSWDEHPVFHAETNPAEYYFEMVSGTLQIAFNIQGYEAPGA